MLLPTSSPNDQTHDKPTTKHLKTPYLQIPQSKPTIPTNQQTSSSLEQRLMSWRSRWRRMLPQNRGRCVRAVSFLFFSFFRLSDEAPTWLRHGVDQCFEYSSVPTGSKCEYWKFFIPWEWNLGEEERWEKKIKEKIDKKETMNLDLQQGTQSWELRRTNRRW